MIYPANFEQKVGFDRLREQVAALCTIRGGRERLCAEQFSTSQADVERRLALADEMRRLLEMEHDFPDDEFVDVDYILSKLKIEGSFLEVEEVGLLRRALASAGAIAGFILGRGEERAVPLRSGGKLGDIAPTLLDLWGLAKPGVMSGESLVEGVRG